MIEFLILVSCMGCLLGAAGVFADIVVLTDGMAMEDRAGFEDPCRICVQTCKDRCEPDQWNTGICKD